MTKEFAENQLKDLKNYLHLIQTDYEYFKKNFGEIWIEEKVHEILNEMQVYKDFLAQFE